MDQGWSGYYDSAQDDAFPSMGDLSDFRMGELVTMGAPIGLQYTPDLAPVGSKSTYFPRSVTNDAIALTFLGFDAGVPGGGISQQSDMNSGTGAWEPTFRAAVTAFQKANGLTVDGWIGPATRTLIKTRVDQKNATTPNVPEPPKPTPPSAIPPPSPSNQVPVNPAVPGQPAPATGLAALSTGAKVGIAAGVAAVAAGLYYAFK